MTTVQAADWVPYTPPAERETLKQFLRWMLRTVTKRKQRRYVHSAYNAVIAAGKVGVLTDGRIIVKLSDKEKATARDAGGTIDATIDMRTGGRSADRWAHTAEGWFKDNARAKADEVGEPTHVCTDQGEDGKTWYYLPPRTPTGKGCVVEARYYDLMKRFHPDARPFLARGKEGGPVFFYNPAGAMLGAVMSVDRSGPAGAS